MSTYVFKNKRLPYFLVLPQLVVISLFFFWPAFSSLRLSFLETAPFGDKYLFIGLRNFARLLSSFEYIRSIGNTLVFSMSVTCLGLLFSLFIAILANQKIKGLPLYRTALLWPYGIAPPIAGFIWMFIFHPTYGLAPNLIFRMTGVAINWQLDGAAAMILMIITAIWTQLGYNIAFLIAGLQFIPKNILEAASVDGAASLQRFVKVTLPLLSPVVFFLLVMNMIYALFETFGVVHAITQGGPGGATETLVYKAYKDGIIALNLGSSAAQSVFLMILAIGFTALQFRFAERKVHY